MKTVSAVAAAKRRGDGELVPDAFAQPRMNARRGLLRTPSVTSRRNAKPPGPGENPNGKSGGSGPAACRRTRPPGLPLGRGVGLPRRRPAVYEHPRHRRSMTCQGNEYQRIRGPSLDPGLNRRREVIRSRGGAGARPGWERMVSAMKRDTSIEKVMVKASPE